MLKFLLEIINNRAVTTPILAWFLAQSIKFFHNYVKHRKFDFKKLIDSGGMPSSHTAFTVSLATILGIHNGFNSDIFAMSVIFSLIVMADAAGVRRAAGKQAEVLNKLVNSSEHVQLDKQLKELLGHTPVEVLAGAALGIITGLALN